MYCVLLLLSFLIKASEGSCSWYEMHMYDAYGDSWSGAEYSIRNASWYQVASGECSGSNTTDWLCLEDGCYSFEVSDDDYNDEVSWQFGHWMNGSSPFGPVYFLADNGTVYEDGCYLNGTEMPTPDTPYPTGMAEPVRTYANLDAWFSESDLFLEYTVMTTLYFSDDIVISGVNRTLYGYQADGILDAEFNTRLFSVDTDGVLTLNSLTLANGYEDEGGCLYAETNAIIILSNVTAMNCIAHSNDGGLAYIWDSSKIYLYNVQADYNMAWYGFGGLVSALQSEVYIENGNFSFNVAEQCGAIRVDKSKLIVSDAIFYNNTASDYSGGVFCAEYASTLYTDAVDGAGIYATDCTFSSNFASQHGAVSFSSSSDVRFENCIATHNSAAIDGGVCYEYFSESLLILGGYYSDNTAMNDGGVIATAGLYVGTITLVDMDATRNLAYNDGGVLYADYGTGGGAILRGGSFVSNYGKYGGVLALYNAVLNIIDHAAFGQNSAEYGGVIHTYYTLAASVNTLFYSNNATFGAVFSIDESEDTLYLYNCTARENTAAAQGGVIYCAKALCNIYGEAGTHLSLNRAVEGSAVYIPPVCSATIQGLNLTQNEAQFSGTIYASLDSTATIRNVTSFANKADASGALIYCGTLSSIVLQDVTSLQDYARFYGVIYVSNLATLRLTDSSLQNADVYRGSVYLTGASLVEIVRTSFIGCQARADGAAVFAESFDALTLAAVIFQGNVASKSAAALYLDGEGPYLATTSISSTLAIANEAELAAVLYATNGVRIDVTDSNFTQNTATSTDEENSGIGGVAALTAGARLQLQDTTVTKNDAGRDAGFALLYGTPPATIESLGGNVFTNNIALTGNGGVFTLDDNATVVFTASDEVLGNSAPLGGGGVAYFDHTSTLTPNFYTDSSLASIFNGNTALYGDLAASYVASIQAEHNSDYEASGSNFETPIIVTARDTLGQTVKTSIDKNVELDELWYNATLDGSLKVSFESGIATTAVFVLYGPVEDTRIPIQATLELDYATYRDTLKVHLRPCVSGEHWNDGKHVCEWCAAGTHSFSPKDSCKSCDENAECPGGFHVEPHRGYWRSKGYSANIRKCLITSHCKGGIDIWTVNGSSNEDAVCADRQSGPLCAVCDNGYSFNSKKECVKCPAFLEQILSIALILGSSGLLFAIVYGVYKILLSLTPISMHNCKQYLCCKYTNIKKSNVFSWTKFKLLIIHWQTLSAQISVFNFISYPSSTSALRFIGFDIASILTMMSCKADFLDRLFMVTLIPFLLLSLVMIRHFFKRLQIEKRSSTSDNTADGADPKDEDTEKTKQRHGNRIKKLNDQTITIVLTITFVVFTTVSNIVFATFRCDKQFNGSDGEPKDSRYFNEAYLVHDYSIRCNSPRHKAYVLYATIMIIIYPCGIPLIFFTLLYANLDTINPSDERLLSVAKEVNANEAAQKNNTPESAKKPQIINGLMVDTTDSAKRYSTVSVLEGPRELVPESNTGVEGVLHQYPKEIREKAHDYIKIVRSLGENAMPTKNCGQEFRLLLRERETRIDSLKILFYDYLPEYWYFEIVMCISRLCMTCVLPAFIETDNQLGLLYATTLVCFGFCVMIIMLKPFVDSSVNYASSMLAALTTLTMTLTVWLFVEDNLVKSVRARWSTTSLGNSLLYLNVTLGPLSLVFDITMEFGILAFVGSLLAGFLSFQFWKVQKKVKQVISSPKAKVTPEYPSYSCSSSSQQEEATESLAPDDPKPSTLDAPIASTPSLVDNADSTVAAVDSPTASSAGHLPPIRTVPTTTLQDDYIQNLPQEISTEGDENDENDNVSVVNLQN